jgi:hypothetical protein
MKGKKGLLPCLNVLCHRWLDDNNPRLLLSFSSTLHPFGLMTGSLFESFDRGYGYQGWLKLGLGFWLFRWLQMLLMTCLKLFGPFISLFQSEVTSLIAVCSMIPARFHKKACTWTFVSAYPIDMMTRARRTCTLPTLLPMLFEGFVVRYLL